MIILFLFVMCRCRGECDDIVCALLLDIYTSIFIRIVVGKQVCALLQCLVFTLVFSSAESWEKRSVLFYVSNIENCQDLANIFLYRFQHVSWFMYGFLLELAVHLTVALAPVWSWITQRALRMHIGKICLDYREPKIVVCFQRSRSTVYCGSLERSERPMFN